MKARNLIWRWQNEAQKPEYYIDGSIPKKTKAPIEWRMDIPTNEGREPL
jgi:hypothetical protein